MSLIAIMSIGVIALVVWLITVFLSVNEGIKKNWLGKLTTLNGPVRITPTNAYFQSHYYQIDSISDASNYTLKSLGEKANSEGSYPYDPEIDSEIPGYWPDLVRKDDGTPLDPVKELMAILDRNPKWSKQEYETSAVLLQLSLDRGAGRSTLSQASYIATFPANNPKFKPLLLPPRREDIRDIRHIKVTKVKAHPHQPIPKGLLHESKPYNAHPIFNVGVISHVILGTSNGVIKRIKDRVIYQKDDVEFNCDQSVIHSPKERVFDVPPGASWGDLEVVAFEPKMAFENAPEEMPPWAYTVGDTLYLPEDGVLLAKSFQENGVRVGDQADLVYTSGSAGPLEERRYQLRVAGFYDPGVMSIGIKCAFVSPEIVHSINASGNSLPVDDRLINGMHLWFDKLESAPQVKAELLAAMETAGIRPYFDVQSFYEYEFAQDLMQQFQSDQTLFTLIGIIILIVACCNIISLLVILVNDKKKEIGILEAMGATKKSIAAIFGLCGVIIGLVSTLLGVLFAILTLKNLDVLVHGLNALQGHQMFNPSFFGEHLPNTLSDTAVLILCIATPLISLIAGLIPAIKACSLEPAQILRSE